MQEAEQQADGGALARAVRTEEAEDLPLAHADAQVVERKHTRRPPPAAHGDRGGQATVLLGQSEGLDGRRRHPATLDGRAHQGGGSVPRSVPALPGIEASGLPFSQVVEANGLVFLAGQVGSAPGESNAVPGGIAAETRQMLDNVGRLLRAVGLDYRDVVKSTVYLRDFADFEAMNQVYREFSRRSRRRERPSG
jgi:enamine deaminase RidA (YjgF/YER057c/UK114 family)